MIWFSFLCPFHFNSLPPHPLQRLHQDDSGEFLPSLCVSPAGTPNTCVCITLSDLSFYFNMNLSSGSQQKNLKATTSVSPFISSQEAPHFHPGIFGPGDGLSQLLLFWIIKGSATRGGRNGRDGAESHMTCRGASALEFLFPPSHTSTEDGLSQLREESKVKAGPLSGDSYSCCFLFWPGASPPEVGTSPPRLKLEKLPWRTAWPQKQRVKLTKQKVKQSSDLFTSYI